MAEATAQRKWRAACPNCGAPVEFASAASASAVCSFCRSTLLRDGETLSFGGGAAEEPVAPGQENRPRLRRHLAG